MSASGAITVLAALFGASACAAAPDAKICGDRSGVYALLAEVDLKGPARRVGLRTPEPGGALQGAAAPARLLAGESAKGGKRTRTLYLCAADRLVWREVSDVFSDDGRGYTSFSLQLTPSADGWAELTLNQTATPRKGAAANRPGPPLALRFLRGSDGVYARA